MICACGDPVRGPGEVCSACRGTNIYMAEGRSPCAPPRPFPNCVLDGYPCAADPCQLAMFCIPRAYPAEEVRPLDL